MFLYVILEGEYSTKISEEKWFAIDLSYILNSYEIFLWIFSMNKLFHKEDNL